MPEIEQSESNDFMLLSQHPDLVEELVRTLPGRDFTLEKDHKNIVRGPIKHCGVVWDKEYVRFMFFNLEWVAEPVHGKWHLLEQPTTPDENARGLRWIEVELGFTDACRFSDGAYGIQSPLICGIYIYPPGDNIKPGGDITDEYIRSIYPELLF